MRRPVFSAVLLVSGLLLLPQISITDAASAESRVALVISQSAYRAVPALPNAANDGKGMAELLDNAGFQVTAASDLSQNEMRQAISDFAAKVAASGPDTVALVFYAGHGLQIDGENYLVPIDVDPKREADIPLQAVRLNDLMNTLGALPTRMRIFLLDACRNNPFPALSQTAGHGLAIVNTKAGAPGSFISFSTSPGSEAEDGNGADSPYTTALLKVAREANLQIEEAMKQVRLAVYQATEGRQVPWDSSSLTAAFAFISSDVGAGQGAAAPKPPSTPAKSVGDWRKDLQGKEPGVAYDLVIADISVAALEAFTTLFTQSPYTPRARSLLERQRQMLAWETAVAINTAASFQVFLASYANGDLAATARKLEERVHNRSLGATAALTSTNVALAPTTCPCTTQPTLPLLKKVDTAPTKREKSSSKRRPPPDEVIVERGSSGPPAAAIMEGVGMGLLLGGGMGGGGMGGRGQGTPMPRNNNYGR
jgi:hypothetical protein